MGDRIRLLAMQFYAHHGADDAERALGQRFEVDLELATDLRAAGESDNLDHALDYRAAYELVAAAMTPPCRLLEALAERIAGRVRARWPHVVVTVRVRKPSVPIGGVLAAAEVELTRP
jgi:dihydroneopterin aldolase